MRKLLFLALIALLFSKVTLADKGRDSVQQKAVEMMAYIDSVNTAMKYETGKVKLPNSIATLNIPAGFKYLNAEQSKFVLNEVWGNPARMDILGMVFPAAGAPFADSSYAYVISYDKIGYVKDEDADEIDYSELLKQMQEGEVEENKERAKDGYEAIHMVGWAQQPFYDKERKVLHWAKELKFGEQPDENTLNYDIRVLGRKGVLSFNAVAGISGLPIVKQDIDKVLAMSDFTTGNKYSDFDSNIDEVAAYSIGGLVAGKVLMKIGFWAVIAKFWKLIIGGIVAAFYGVKRFFTGKKEESQVETEPVPEVSEEEKETIA